MNETVNNNTRDEFFARVVKVERKQFITFSPADKNTMIAGRIEGEPLKRSTKHNLLLTAHRGGGPTSVFGKKFPDKYLPENSLEAIKKAILQGADAIEIDIFKSKDGVLIVTHDDEIWRNGFNMDRKGNELPPGETKETFLVSQKTALELNCIPIGRNGETMPTLSEVVDMVKNANEILRESEPDLKSQGVKSGQIILNIELKDKSTINEVIKFLKEEVKKEGNGFLDNIIFCSFHHEALIQLRRDAEKHDLQGIRIAPGIKTAELFGKDNVNEDFSLKPNAKYQTENVERLKKLVEENKFTGYDAILWDIRKPLVDIATFDKKKKEIHPVTSVARSRRLGLFHNYLKSEKSEKGEKKEIHASTSDFRQYGERQDFAYPLLEISKHTLTFFKCDDVPDARQILFEKRISMNGIGTQMVCYRGEGQNYFSFYRAGVQDNSHSLKEGARKPEAFSKKLALGNGN